MNAQIAQHLNVSEHLILEVQEWAAVLWVRFVGGCRFVSKKKVKQMTQPIPSSVVSKIAFCERVKADPARFAVAKQALVRLAQSGKKQLQENIRKADRILIESGIAAIDNYLNNN